MYIELFCRSERLKMMFRFDARSGSYCARDPKLVGPVNPQQVITFTVWLKLRNKEQLDHFVSELYDSQSSYYQKFLTKEEYETNFVLDAKAIQEVEHYLPHQG